MAVEEGLAFAVEDLVRCRVRVDWFDELGSNVIGRHAVSRWWSCLGRVAPPKIFEPPSRPHKQGQVKQLYCRYPLIFDAFETSPAYLHNR